MIPDWLPTVLGAAGMAALFWPAYRANRMARRFTKLERIAEGGQLPDSLREPARETVDQRQRHIGKWSLLDELLMWTGYGGLAQSYALQLIVNA